jgi:catechol 2,3-dioxygenase-like lactoylglutathione lyase family enzyme
MAESLRFYCEGLGLELESERVTGGPYAREIWALATHDVKVVFLKVPGSDARIELFEFEDIERHDASSRPCDFGSGHFCLLVDDLDRVYARLADLGYQARSPGPVSITVGPHAGAKAIYLIDPSGYHVELYQRAA